TGVVLAVIAAGVVVAGQYLAVHTPGKSSDDLYADLITVDAPVVTRARAGGNEELVDYPGNTPGQPKRPAAPATGQTPTEVARRDPAPPRPRPNNPSPGDKGKGGEEDPDGMGLGSGGEDQIKQIVATHQKGLFPCLKTVAK